MKKIVNTDKAPAAIGPYAQAVEIDSLVITSGQLPIDPATGAFPEGIAEQTRQSLTNVKAILAEAGLGMDKVIKKGLGREIPFSFVSRGTGGVQAG